MFSQVLAELAELGVERYHADLVRAEVTCYLPSGHSVLATVPRARMPPARILSEIGVEVAARAVHRRRIGYAEFCERLAAAGCVAYAISLAGGRAVYWGRSGTSYSERLSALDQLRGCAADGARCVRTAGTIPPTASSSASRR